MTNKKIVSFLTACISMSALIINSNAANVNFEFSMVNPIDGITHKTDGEYKDDDDQGFYVKVKKPDIIDKDLFYISAYKSSGAKVSKDVKVTPNWLKSKKPYRTIYTQGQNIGEGSKIQLAGRSDRYYCSLSGTWCP